MKPTLPMKSYTPLPGNSLSLDPCWAVFWFEREVYDNCCCVVGLNFLLQQQLPSTSLSPNQFTIVQERMVLKNTIPLQQQIPSTSQSLNQFGLGFRVRFYVLGFKRSRQKQSRKQQQAARGSRSSSRQQAAAGRSRQRQHLARTGVAQTTNAASGTSGGPSEPELFPLTTTFACRFLNHDCKTLMMSSGNSLILSLCTNLSASTLSKAPETSEQYKPNFIVLHMP